VRRRASAVPDLANVQKFLAQRSGAKTVLVKQINPKKVFMKHIMQGSDGAARKCIFRSIGLVFIAATLIAFSCHLGGESHQVLFTFPRS
jgi:hypothetical protein